MFRTSAFAADPVIARTVGRVLNSVWAADRLVRLHFLVFSGVWPLLGAASVQPVLTLKQVAGLLGAMFAFHTYTMVLNDIVDLPIDRTDPRRQRDLIASGRIGIGAALAIVLAQPFICVVLTLWMGRGWSTLAVGFAAMTMYDLSGKRCVFPPLTDAIQGIGWASLAVYGAQAVGSAPNTLTWIVAAYAVVFTLLFNGIHGPLRDLANDFVRGARTTAIFFGARPGGADRGGHTIPTPVKAYAWMMAVGVVVLSAAVVLRNDLGYATAAQLYTGAVVLTIDVLILLLQFKVVRPLDPAWEAAYRLQLYAVTIGLPAAFFVRLDRATLTSLFLLNAVSLLMFESTPLVVAWSWRALRAAVTGTGGAGVRDPSGAERLEHVHTAE